MRGASRLPQKFHAFTADIPVDTRTQACLCICKAKALLPTARHRDLTENSNL